MQAVCTDVCHLISISFPKCICWIVNNGFLLLEVMPGSPVCAVTRGFVKQTVKNKNRINE